jgi:tellurite resistance protein
MRDEDRLMEQQTDAHWILKAMVAVAGADGRLSAREVALIQKVYEDETGRAVDASGILRAVEAYATRRDVLAELSQAAGSLSAEVKEKTVRAAYLTLLADKRVAGDELKKLKDIAAALDVSERQFQAIIDGAERNSGEEPD